MNTSEAPLKDRVAIVTGGGTGIGKAIALEFARAGADVVVASRNLENLEKTAAEVRALGRRSAAIATDVTIAEQARNMASQTADQFGRIDILVNNSGVSVGKTMSLTVDQSEEDWDTVIDTNLKGTFLCTQAAAKQMMDQKSGKIINISSMGGVFTTRPGLVSYCAAKAGVIAFTRAVAAELAPYGITVNSVSPGVIETDMYKRGRTPEQIQEWVDTTTKATVVGRLGTTRDVAKLVLYLASDDSSFICAENITIDGYFAMRCVPPATT
jgi:NAD(P)-dependent dehydrogenase (short-subunit alcohol dehydrogenase family)